MTINKQSREWMIENKRNISQRLAWVASKQDGLLIHHHDGEEEIMIVKKGHFVFLHFVEKNPKTNEDEISDVMSFIDITNPLMLHSIYAQGMLLSLLFVTSPQHIYMLGFGGGRIPLVLHHHFSDLQIESSELSESVISTLEMCFGVKTDNRLHIDKINGREHLRSFSNNKFDIIMLDSFSGAGNHPNELSSIEFYHLCQSKLTRQGVVVTNLVDNNPMFKQKVQTFCASFKYVYEFSHEVNHVYLGSNTVNVSTGELIQRAITFDEKYTLGFKLADIAKCSTKLHCDHSINLLRDNVSLSIPN